MDLDTFGNEITIPFKDGVIYKIHNCVNLIHSIIHHWLVLSDSNDVAKYANLPYTLKVKAPQNIAP